MSLEIRVDKDSRTLVACISGYEIVEEAPRRILDAVRDNPGYDLVLNCKDFHSISSMSLAVLVELHMKCHNQKRLLVVAAVEPGMLDQLRITRLDLALNLVPDEKAAIAFLAEKRRAL